MSQRQLAQQSGVDHSTISRLIRGDRMPSLGTATKLARGLRELRDDADTPAVPRPHVVGLVESDRPSRVRPACRRRARRAAGSPDHGVLPGSPDASPRADVWPDERAGAAASVAVPAGRRCPSESGRRRDIAYPDQRSDPSRDGPLFQPAPVGATDEPLLNTASIGPDPSLHVRVSGIANAGPLGGPAFAFVRREVGPLRYASGARQVDRERPARRRLPTVDEPDRDRPLARLAPPPRPVRHNRGRTAHRTGSRRRPMGPGPAARVRGWRPAGSPRRRPGRPSRGGTRRPRST